MNCAWAVVIDDCTASREASAVCSSDGERGYPRGKLRALFGCLLHLGFDDADMLGGAFEVARQPFELRVARDCRLLVLAKLKIELRDFAFSCLQAAAARE